jgi:hypothetical protein
MEFWPQTLNGAWLLPWHILQPYILCAKLSDIVYCEPLGHLPSVSLILHGTLGIME